MHVNQLTAATQLSSKEGNGALRFVMDPLFQLPD